VIGSTLVDRVQLSPNFESRWNGLQPTLLVLHYTGMKSGPAAVDWLCNPSSKVSCHYLIDVDGEIVQMVDETQRAWHAGVSSWHGQTDVNSQSIGIEIQNEGHAAGCPLFDPKQMQRVGDLCLDIMARYRLAPHDVIGHSDIAPGRKIDPGEAFNWRALALRGVGQCVVALPTHDLTSSIQIDDAQRLINLLGYGLDSSGVWDERMRIVLKAIQQHYRADKVDGVLDIATSELIKRLQHLLPRQDRSQFSV
jgi:N-acetylmuramoyl-L-alanine amidase